MTDIEFDKGLAAVLGDKFHDETMHIKTQTAAQPKKQTEPVKVTAAKDKPIEQQWEPVKPAPDDLERLKSAFKGMLPYSVLSIVIFWWQQSGRLEANTAWYALLVCVGMVFFEVGKCFGRGRNNVNA